MGQDLDGKQEWARSDLTEKFDWARSDLTGPFDWARRGGFVDVPRRSML